MNRATELAINQRLEDKAERDPNVLRDHLDDQDAHDATIAAFVQKQFANHREEWSNAQDTIDRVWNTCLEEYIGANFQSELSEMIAEMDEARVDAEREERAQ